MIRFDRRLLQNFDWPLMIALLMVIIMGLANLYSATYQNYESGSGAFLKQIVFYVVGFGIGILIISIDYRTLLSWNYPLYAVVLLLLITALLVGKTVGGGQRWINLGFFRLQPSEPAKLILIIALASYYYRRDNGHGFSLKDLVIPMALTVVPAVLIALQPDLGTALMLGFIFVSMTLFVRLKRKTLISLICSCLALIPIGWHFVLKPYQKLRILTMFNPESDPRGAGYHITQSKIALGSGLKFGKGFLKGTQGHLDFLPERHTDFAFSVWAEEWGFIGSLFFLGCYLFLLLLCLNTALSSRDKFGFLLAVGIVSLIFWQAFINLAMIMGLMPVVGVPLPLFSYGGSSLFTTLFGIAILFSIRVRRYMASTI